MNPLEQVNMCQNYIIVIKLHQDRSIITSKSKTSQNWVEFWAVQWKIGKNPLCAAPDSLCIAPLWSWIWGPSSSPNWAHDISLESPTYLFSNSIKISRFGVHLPLQNSISQDCFLCVKIGAVRSFFECFWPLEGSKFSKISWPYTKNYNVSCQI